jgi:uncharacterized protein (TIGR02145 family)
MKNKNWIYSFIIMGVLLLITGSCRKDDNNIPTDTVKDIDGNVYHKITIGTQVWMVENLKVTKYNDGTAIPNVTDNTAWKKLETPGYCWYNNDISNKNIYGSLYIGHTISVGKLCPVGWHIPTNAEWTKLTTFLGGMEIAGGKLKETGTSHWKGTNLGATNETGFTALPGGYRNSDGTYNQIESDGFWWSSTDVGSSGAWYREIRGSFIYVFGEGGGKSVGLSIRCIKD